MTSTTCRATCSVSSEVDHPAAPGEDIDKVFQPYGVANANGTALSTSDLVALQKRPVSVGMIRQLSASEIVSLSASQVEAIKADGRHGWPPMRRARPSSPPAIRPSRRPPRT